MKATCASVLSLLFLMSANAFAQNWTVGGNNLASNGRIGANGNVDVIFETNNAARGRVTGSGLWAFGVTTPAARVHIGTSSGKDALRVDLGNQPKLVVTGNGGTAIGGISLAPPANGLYVAAGTTIGGAVDPPSNGLYVAGNAGFGSSPGSYKVKITHGTFGFNIENSTTLDDWEFWSNSAGLALYSNGNFRGQFNPTTGAYASVSDERVKTNIQAMPSVLGKLGQLRPVTYQMHQDGLMTDASLRYGFVAQDVAEVFPHLAEHYSDAERGLDSWALDYSGFGVLAVKAVQELEAKVETLEARIARLEAALAKR